MTAVPFEFVSMAAVGALVGLGAAVWAAGQLSARLFSGAWLPVEAVEMGAVLVRLLKNPAHPAAAWPSGSRQLVPGAIAFWTTFGTVTLLPLLGALWLRVRTGRQSEVHSAAWASRKQLSPLRVSAPTPGRITLGYADRDLLAVEPRQSVIVIGPSQSGKTTGLAIPALLEWDGPVIATSVKQDLLADSIVRRRQMGRVWVYDPTGTSGTGGPRATWSPVAASGTWQGAQRTAAWLVDAARDGGLQDADFWYATAAKLLAPLLLAAATSEHTMADVVRWVDTQEEREVRFELEAAGVIEALHAADASWRREERQKSSVYTTAETVLRAFADPAVASSAVTSEIQPELLLDGGAHTLYVCAPSHEQSRLRPLFSALLQQVITAAYERAASDEPLRRPLLIVLDEAANIAPLPELDTLASTAAGVGIQLVTVWQDLAQIHTRYGDRAATVVNNHRAKIALSGISDTRTLEYFSRLVGESETSRSSTTIDSNGQVSRTEAVQHRRLAPDEALRQMTPNHGLLLYGHIPPAQLQLRPWYRNRTLTNSARGTPARRMTSAMRLPGDSAAAGRREEHGNVADAGNFGNGGSASP